MPRHYPAELRRQTCPRMLAGEAVKELVVELGISDHTLYRWRRQAQIDAGERPGTKSYEGDPLQVADCVRVPASSHRRGTRRHVASLADRVESCSVEPLSVLATEGVFSARLVAWVMGGSPPRAVWPR